MGNSASIYDLLFSDTLSKQDIQKIKQLSVDLLRKIKERISQMDHWTDKDETKATVQNLIRDELYMSIPDSMFDQLDHRGSQIDKKSLYPFPHSIMFDIGKSVQPSRREK